MKPPELTEAELIVGLCERFHVLPSVLLAEDVELLRYIAIADLGRSDE